jgi:hypothetical protein
MMRRLSVIVATLLLVGAGCTGDIAGFLGSKIRLPSLPFMPSAGDPAAAALAVRSAPGTKILLRPTFLGVTGTLNDVLGTTEGLRIATIQSYGKDAAGLTWTEGERKGEVSAAKTAEAGAMLLPAFWKDGKTAIEGNAVIWLSAKAYAELAESGKTEWRVGLADAELGTAAALLKTFNGLAAKLSASATATAPAASPFLLAVTGDDVVFPLRVGGKIENVRAIRATSWLADYLILKNPENPLILKVNVNPLAISALNAFKTLGIEPDKIGYEAVGVEPPTPESSEGG